MKMKGKKTTIRCVVSIASDPHAKNDPENPWFKVMLFIVKTATDDLLSAIKDAVLRIGQYQEEPERWNYRGMFTEHHFLKMDTKAMVLYHQHKKESMIPEQELSMWMNVLHLNRINMWIFEDSLNSLRHVFPNITCKWSSILAIIQPLYMPALRKLCFSEGTLFCYTVTVNVHQ